MMPLSLLLAVTLAAAPPPEPSAWAQGQVGLLNQSNAGCLSNASALGAGLGRWETREWGWEASLLQGRVENTARTWKATELHLDASALYAPWDRQGNWTPYLRVGAGLSRLDSPLSLTGGSATKPNLIFGGGAQLALSEKALATFEARSVTVATSTRRQELALLAGIGWRWSREKK